MLPILIMLVSIIWTLKSITVFILVLWINFFTFGKGFIFARTHSMSPLANAFGFWQKLVYKSYKYLHCEQSVYYEVELIRLTHYNFCFFPKLIVGIIETGEAAWLYLPWRHRARAYCVTSFCISYIYQIPQFKKSKHLLFHLVWNNILLLAS